LLTVTERERLEVEVFKATRAPIPPSYLRGLLQRAVALPEVEARLPAGTASIVVRLTTDNELRRLNRDFAGLDSVTDVLSFAGSNQHLGDLAISWPMVVRQAREYRQPQQTELGLLCVHGLLHLLGWEHVTAPQRKEMSRLTIDALALSGLRLAPGRL
jgi:probable rRNA maturation factor